MLHAAILAFTMTVAGFNGADSSQNSAEGERASRRILITNDDGIDSPAIAALLEELSSFGELVVVAPAENQSGSSHSMIAYAAPIEVNEIEIEGADAAYAIGGRPADAVNFGIIHVGRDDPFDLVISGINIGANIGATAHISGTVGAAKEAVVLGVPAVSVSLNGRTFDVAASVTAQFVEELFRRGATPGVVYAINIPTPRADRIAGVTAAPMGGLPWAYRAYEPFDDGETPNLMRARLARNDEEPAGTDTSFFASNHITITPLRINLTHEDALADLKRWDLPTVDDDADE